MPSLFPKIKVFKKKTAYYFFTGLQSLNVGIFLTDPLYPVYLGVERLSKFNVSPQNTANPLE